MKVGQIIRKKTHSGTPIGPYMRIEHIDKNSDCVYASVIGLDTPNESILINNVHIPDIRTLYVSEEKLWKIKRKAGSVLIAHPSCKTWNKVFEEMPELLRIVARPKMYEVICATETFYKRISRRETIITISLNRTL